jgi:hypothetical protein
VSASYSFSVSNVPTPPLPLFSQPLPVNQPSFVSSTPLSQSLTTSQVPTTSVKVPTVILVSMTSLLVANLTQAPLTVKLSDDGDDLLDDGTNTFIAPSQQHPPSFNCDP